MREISRKVVLLCLCNAILVIFTILYLQKSTRDTVRLSRNINEQMANTSVLFTNIVGKRTQLCLIEPHVLYDLLSKDEKQRLSGRVLEIIQRKKQDDVLHFAVLSTDIKVLSNESIHQNFKSHGFRTWEITSQTLEPRSSQKHHHVPDHGKTKRINTHYVYMKNGVILHITVLYDQGSYLWHDDLPLKSVRNFSSVKKLKSIFTENQSSYSRFDFHPSPLLGKYIHVPSNISKFLLETNYARFIPCNGYISWTNISETALSSSDAPYWLFKSTTLSLIDELEQFLDSASTPYWLASGTLLGWYRDCGLIPYTSDVDFAMWRHDVDESFISRLLTHESIKVINKLGKLNDDLEFWLIYRWLRADIFLTYETSNNETYVGGHSPNLGYSFRYMFPKFSLCTGHFLGRRVYVPCEPEKIIEAEYGKNWRKPVNEWEYELSARNVYGRRYWSTDEIQEFQEFRRP